MLPNNSRERLNGIQEVSGLIPLISTIMGHGAKRTFGFVLLFQSRLAARLAGFLTSLISATADTPPPPLTTKGPPAQLSRRSSDYQRSAHRKPVSEKRENGDVRLRFDSRLMICGASTRSLRRNGFTGCRNAVLAYHRPPTDSVSLPALVFVSLQRAKNKCFDTLRTASSTEPAVLSCY